MKATHRPWRLAKILLPALVLPVALVAACERPEKEELLVFAAASLRDVLSDLAGPFEGESGAEVRFNFAGSNTLALQIEASGRGDVFLSADEAWMDYLERAQRLEAETRRVFISNRLVMIGNRARTRPLRWATSEPGGPAPLPPRHLALADPRAVPAGRYAREALQNRYASVGDFEPRKTLWQIYLDSMVPAADVRAVLALVEADPETLGIVYRSDAGSSELVEVLWEVPEAEGPEIRYSAAVLRGAVNEDLASRYLDFLAEPRAVEVFERHGFSPPPPPSGKETGGG